MGKAVMALLSGAYLFVALTAAALFWRAGAGWGAGAAVLVGGLAFAFGLHNLIARNLGMGAIRDELERLQSAHAILADELDKTRALVATVEVKLHQETDARAEALTGEVRMLEDLVARMGESLDARIFASNFHGPTPGIDRERAALLSTIRESLAENRVDLYLQPVVSLPPRRTVFYESFSRLRDESGRILMPAEYLKVAEPEGLLPAIDNLLLFRCVQIVRRLAKQDRKVGIFCNISLTSLGDETFFPQFLDFLSQNKDLSGALIFELGQQAFNERGSLEARNMAKLADLGFRFSLDKVTELDLNFADLGRADVKFIKIAADVLLKQLLEVDGRPALRALKDLHASDFADLTRRYGVEVIAEKVEHERQVIDILELDVRYGQGHLFGEPRAIKEAVLAETDPPAEFMRGALRRRAGRRN
jgi:cyclic-di-GMP phosphodiesterase TipF (flagellum assembly factor)